MGWIRIPEFSQKIWNEVRWFNPRVELGSTTFIIPSSESTSILDLHFTEKLYIIENLTASASLGNLKRFHISLRFDYVIDSPGNMINFKKANLDAISRHFNFIDWDKVLMPINANNSYEYCFDKYHKCYVLFLLTKFCALDSCLIWSHVKLIWFCYLRFCYILVLIM